MIRLSPEAEIQIELLIEHYEAKERRQATLNLLHSLERARERIAADPGAGLAAPRSYPSLRRQGRLWIIEGRYWISYSVGSPPSISGVFYVTADIPNRI